MDKYVIIESERRDEEMIINELVKYNLSKVPAKQHEEFIYINRTVKNENGDIIAGILSRMYCWNCLYIDTLWVKEEYRGEGLGSKLLSEVEKAATEQGCELIHLDTFDFQAKDFYLSRGYEIFGVLEQCPKGHNRYFMKKKCQVPAT